MNDSLHMRTCLRDYSDNLFTFMTSKANVEKMFRHHQKDQGFQLGLVDYHTSCKETILAKYNVL